jgi:transposase
LAGREEPCSTIKQKNRLDSEPPSHAPRSRFAMESGTHSPRISRLLSDLGHEVIVADARKARLIGEIRQENDRLDAQSLARLARIDPALMSS